MFVFFCFVFFFSFVSFLFLLVSFFVSFLFLFCWKKHPGQRMAQDAPVTMSMLHRFASQTGAKTPFLERPCPLHVRLVQAVAPWRAGPRHTKRQARCSHRQRLRRKKRKKLAAIINHPMRINARTRVTGARSVLVPYKRHHVPKYHGWMQNAELLEQVFKSACTKKKERDRVCCHVTLLTLRLMPLLL
jgi:hypothetical protein